MFDPMTQNPSSRRWWSVVNAPLVVALVGLLAAGGWKLYSSYQDALADQATRKVELSKLFDELQQRLSYLADADEELTPYLGEGTTFKGAKKLQPSTAEARRWERKVLEVGQKEWDVVHGRGTYLPSSPEFSGVTLQSIASQSPS